MKIYRTKAVKSFRKVPFADNFPYYETYLRYVADVVRKYPKQYSILKESGDAIFRDENDSQYEREYSGVLAYGQVQSGKTAVMILSIIEAYNLGFKNVFVLTGNNDSLHRQTMSRFKKDIGDFNKFLDDVVKTEKYNSIDDFKNLDLQKFKSIEPAMIVNYYDLQGKYSLGNSQEKANLDRDINEVFNKNDGMNIFFSLKNVANYRKIEEIANRSDFIDHTNGILILDDEADWGFEDGDSTREAQLFEMLENLRRNVKASKNYLKYVAFTATPYKIFRNYNQQLINEDSIVKLKTKEIEESMPLEFVSDNWPFYCGYKLIHKAGEKDLFTRDTVRTNKENELANAVNRKFISVIPDDYDEDNLLRYSLILFLLNSYIYNSLNGSEYANKKISYGLYFSDWRETKHIEIKESVSMLINEFDKLLDNEVNLTPSTFGNEFLKSTSATENSIKKIIIEKLSEIDMKGFIDYFKKWINLEKQNIDNFVVKMSGNEEEGNLYSDKKPIDGVNAVFIIGGYKLARGVTFDNLLLETITSSSEKEDSTLQRARWFGYRSVNNLKVLDVIMSKEVYGNFEKAIELDDDYRNNII